MHQRRRPQRLARALSADTRSRRQLAQLIVDQRQQPLGRAVAPVHRRQHGATSFMAQLRERTWGSQLVYTCRERSSPFYSEGVACPTKYDLPQK